MKRKRDVWTTSVKVVAKIVRTVHLIGRHVPKVNVLISVSYGNVLLVNMGNVLMSNLLEIALLILNAKKTAGVVSIKNVWIYVKHRLVDPIKLAKRELATPIDYENDQIYSFELNYIKNLKDSFLYLIKSCM